MVTLLLAGCSGGAGSAAVPKGPDEVPAEDQDPWEAGREAGLDFLAVGDGWRLEIRGVQLEMITPYDQATFAEPERRLENGRRVYRGDEDGHTLEAVLARTPCTLGEEDGERLPFTVTVTFDSETYQGCGRKLR
jgi:uncharacterized membrane protein